MNRATNRFSLIALLIIAFNNNSHAENTWSINMNGSNVVHLIKFVADITGQSFVLHNEISGTIEIDAKGSKLNISKVIHFLYENLLIQGIGLDSKNGIIRATNMEEDKLKLCKGVKESVKDILSKNKKLNEPRLKMRFIKTSISSFTDYYEKKSGIFIDPGFAGDIEFKAIFPVSADKNQLLKILHSALDINNYELVENKSGYRAVEIRDPNTYLRCQI